MSIFQTIKNQIVRNELDGDYVIKGHYYIYPNQSFTEKVLQWFEDNKILKWVSKKPQRDNNSWRLEYYRYSVNIDSSFFRGTRLRKDSEAELKDDRMSRGTHSSPDMLADHYYEDKSLYERIDFQDTVASDFIVAEAQCSSYDEWCSKMQEQELDEMEQLALKEFVTYRVAPDYMFEDEYELA